MNKWRWMDREGRNYDTEEMSWQWGPSFECPTGFSCLRPTRPVGYHWLITHSHLPTQQQSSSISPQFITWATTMVNLSLLKLLEHSLCRSRKEWLGSSLMPARESDNQRQCSQLTTKTGDSRMWTCSACFTGIQHGTKTGASFLFPTDNFFLTAKSLLLPWKFAFSWKIPMPVVIVVFKPSVNHAWTMHGYDMYPHPSDVAVNFHWSKNKSD